MEGPGNLSPSLDRPGLPGSNVFHAQSLHSLLRALLGVLGFKGTLKNLKVFRVPYYDSRVDDLNPALPLRTLNYGKYCIFIP